MPPCGPCKNFSLKASCRTPGKFLHKRPEAPPLPTNCREKQLIVNKNFVRQIILPGKRPEHGAIISKDTYNYLRDASKVVTPADVHELASKKTEVVEKAIAESMTRRRTMAEHDEQRTRCESSENPFEQDARARADSLYSQVRMARLEGEEEVKKLNKKIINAKCFALRDEQVKEKILIEKELKAEDIRLDEMMERERQLSMANEQTVEKEKRATRCQTKDFIIGQIAHKNELRVFEAEHKEQEGEAIRQKNALDRVEEVKKREEYMDKKKLWRKEQLEAICELEQRRKQEIERDKLERAQCQEFHRRKGEELDAFEAEVAAVKRSKEREISHLRNQQQTMQDRMASELALKLKREGERDERRWRQRELEEARRRAEGVAELNITRGAQLQEKEHMTAVEMERERAEFQKELDLLRRADELAKIQEQSLQEKKHIYARALKQQICEKEEMRVAERRRIFEEGKHNRLARAQLQHSIAQHKLDKLNQLKDCGISPKYLDVVSKQLAPVEKIPM